MFNYKYNIAINKYVPYTYVIFTVCEPIWFNLLIIYLQLLSFFPALTFIHPPMYSAHKQKILSGN